MKLPSFDEAVVYPYPHGTLISYGKKSLDIRSKRVEKWLHKRLLVVENHHAVGVVELGDEKRLSRSQVISNFDKHLITEDEINEWWPDVETFYAYDVVHSMDLRRPIKVEIPDDAKLWVRPDSIKFSSDADCLAGLGDIADRLVSGYFDPGEIINCILHIESLPPISTMPWWYEWALLYTWNWLKQQPDMLDEKERLKQIIDDVVIDISRLDKDDIQQMSDSKLLRLIDRLSFMPNTEEYEFVRRWAIDEWKRRQNYDLMPTFSEKGDGIVEFGKIEDLFDKAAVLYDRAVCLVGSMAEHGRGNDVDILIRSEIPEPLFRRVAFRLGRYLGRKAPDVQFHILYDDGPFTTYIPLYDIVLMPSKRRVIKMGRSKLPISNKVEIFHPLRPFKPIRIAGEPQTWDNFLRLVEDHGLVGFLEPKVDGVHVECHSDGKRWRIWTEDGTEVTELLEPLFRGVNGLRVVLEGELEVFKGDLHMPREYTASCVHANRPDDFSITFWDIIYLDGDIHGEPFSIRRKKLEELSKKFKWPITIEPRTGLSVIPSFEVKTKQEIIDLMKRILKTDYIEGVVWKGANGIYRTDGRPGDMVKWHRNVVFNAVIIDRIETKTKGVFNYIWAVPFENEPVDERFVVVRNGQKLAIGGKTFASSVRLDPGDVISIEAETINIEISKGKLKVSAWAPKLITEVRE